MLEHLLLPFTLVITFYYPYVCLIILIIFLMSDKKNDDQGYFNFIENEWLTKEKINTIYDWVNDDCNLYKILEYVENRKQFWKKGVFKNKKDGMEKHIYNQIKKIENKEKECLTEIIVMYIYITKQGFENKIPDIEIMECMHDAYQKIMYSYKIIEKKNFENFKNISRKKKIYIKFIYQQFSNNYI